MILISVKSEVYNDKRQFETDDGALKFLKLVAKIHLLQRMQKVGKKPKLKDFSCGNRKITRSRHRAAVKEWTKNIRTAIPLRIEIINTKHNQLSLHI